MSTDFYVWSGPWLSADKFQERLLKVIEGGVPAEQLFYRDRRVLDFLAFAQSKFPPLVTLTATEARKSPWAADPVLSDALLELNLRPSARQSYQVDVLMMASSGGLLVYDAQAHKVYHPRAPLWRALLHVSGLKRLPE